MSSRRLAFVLVLATAATLTAMVIVSFVTGATQEQHEHYSPPLRYSLGLVEPAGGLRVLMGLALAFLILYTGVFAALAEHLKAIGRPFARLALAFMIATAVLDVIEDHQILTALDLAEDGKQVGETWIAGQQILSATKFAMSYLGTFLFGLAIPRTTRWGMVASLFFVAGTLVTALVSLAAPPDVRHILDSTRWLTFLAGFAVLAAWLRTTPDARDA